MGWTRNAQNIVYTNCATSGSTPDVSSGYWGFNDNTPWTVKTPDNKVYQITADAGYSTSWSSSTVVGTGLFQTQASAGELSFTPPQISNAPPVGTYPSSSNSAPISSLRFGSGDDGESFEDCDLSGELLNCSGHCIDSKINYAGKGTFEISMRYAVTANADMVINEWGLFSGITNCTNQVSRMVECLIYRKKLSGPITLVKGQAVSIDIHIVFPKLALTGSGWTRNAQNALYSRAFIRVVAGSTTGGYNDFTDEYPWILKLLDGTRVMAVHNCAGWTSSVKSSFIPLLVNPGGLQVPEIYVADASHPGGFTTDPWPNNCIVFGSGSTAQTFEDYYIENFVACQKVSGSLSVTANNDGTFKISGDIFAKPLEDTIIREWALYGRIVLYPNYNYTYASYMLYREVLDEPITAAAGQAFALHIELDLPKLSIF